MNLLINFDSSRVFWGAIAGAGVLMLLLLALWVIPARNAASEAKSDWETQLKDLETLKIDVAAARIPSKETLSERQKYRDDFVEQETGYVRSFFTNCTQLMEQSLAGQGPVDPSVFKNAYQHEIELRSNELSKGPLKLDPAKAYKRSYPWMANASVLPTPSAYREVLHDYRTRDYLYRAFMDRSLGNAVSKVVSLDVFATVPIEGAPDFEGIRFQVTVAVPPQSVTDLVKSMLAASPTKTNRPVFQFTSIKLTPIAGTANCALQLEGYVLLLKQAETPDAAAANNGGAGKK